MSNAAIPKLERIGFYLMTENVRQHEMQSRYDACSIIQKIIKEIKFGIAVKAQKSTAKKDKK